LKVLAKAGVRRARANRRAREVVFIESLLHVRALLVNLRRKRRRDVLL
jgi:hypothetical protein